MHTRVIKETYMGGSLCLACGWKLLFVLVLCSSSFSSCSSPLARVDGSSFSSGSRHVLSPGLEFWRARVDFVARFGGLLDLLLLVGRSSSARGPDTARTRRSARTFCHHLVRTSGPTRTTRRGKSQLLFSFFSFGFCVNACGKAPVG